MTWQETDNKIQKHFEFANFAEALGFVNKVGELAEAADHHPNILLHDYKNVTITMTTHSEGNMVTEKDRELAEQIDELVS